MKHKVMIVSLAVTACLLIWATQALAQSGLTVLWWTADGGGGSSSGGGYAISGTAGQPDVGAASGGQYAVAGGFWGSGEQPSTVKIHAFGAENTASGILPLLFSVIAGSIFLWRHRARRLHILQLELERIHGDQDLPE